MIKEYLAKRRMRKFLLTMRKTLAKDYGRSKEYTEGQVKTALRKLGYGDDLEEVAIAIFCNEKIAKELGLDETLIKKYKGYPITHQVGPGGADLSGSLGDGGGAGGSD
jgi:hypothetical protein